MLFFDFIGLLLFSLMVISQEGRAEEEGVVSMRGDGVRGWVCSLRIKATGSC